MRFDTGLILILAAVAVVFLGMLTFHTNPPTRWQYEIQDIPDEQFQTQMNSLGNQGWELVFARRAAESDSSDDVDSTTPAVFDYEVILKRPVAASNDGTSNL